MTQYRLYRCPECYASYVSTSDPQYCKACDEEYLMERIKLAQLLDE